MLPYSCTWSKVLNKDVCFRQNCLQRVLVFAIFHVKRHRLFPTVQPCKVSALPFHVAVVVSCKVAGALPFNLNHSGTRIRQPARRKRCCHCLFKRHHQYPVQRAPWHLGSVQKQQADGSGHLENGKERKCAEEQKFRRAQQTIDDVQLYTLRRTKRARYCALPQMWRHPYFQWHRRKLDEHDATFFGGVYNISISSNSPTTQCQLTAI